MSSLVTYCVVLKGSVPWSSFCFLSFLFSEGFFFTSSLVCLFPLCFQSEEFYISLMYHNSVVGWNKASAMSVTVNDDYP